jgi:stearoyl-CoA desaturase (delta-9 desaturase)
MHFMFDDILSYLNGGLLDLSGWQLVVLTLVLTHITIAAVTIYLHRTMAHRALDLHPIVSHFFRGWLWLTTGMVTREWVAIHRKHHAKCETEEDPHSPQIKGHWNVLRFGVDMYRHEAKNHETISKYSHGCPDDWVERNLYSRYTWQGMGVTLLINLALFGVVGVAIWAIQLIWIPVTAAGIINGTGHFWGYRNFDAPDASTNIVPWGIIIGGEELHNNHHAFATSARFSARWYEFDIGWYYIKAMSLVGLADIRKTIPKLKLEAFAKAQADGQTLDAIITNRYEIMRNYAGTLKAAWKSEKDRLHALRGGKCESVAGAKRWLVTDATKLSPDHKSRLAEVLAQSEKLKKLYEMRAELAQLWSRNSLSREQLVANLQAWCVKAEASGVAALQELSKRYRRYAIAA